MSVQIIRSLIHALSYLHCCHKQFQLRSAWLTWQDFKMHHSQQAASILSEHHTYSDVKPRQFNLLNLPI